MRKRGLVDFSFVTLSLHLLYHCFLKEFLLFALVLLSPLFYIIYFPSTFCCLFPSVLFISTSFLFTLFLSLVFTQIFLKKMEKGDCLYEFSCYGIICS